MQIGVLMLLRCSCFSTRPEKEKRPIKHRSPQLGLAVRRQPHKLHANVYFAALNLRNSTSGLGRLESAVPEETRRSPGRIADRYCERPLSDSSPTYMAGLAAEAKVSFIAVSVS